MQVYMLHKVTLGSTGKSTVSKKRHPTIGHGCVLGAGATILGDITLGDGVTVGGGAVVTKSVAPGSTVVGVNRILAAAKTMTKTPRSRL